MDFVGHKTTKIPTLLGLSLLLTAIILGGFLYWYRENVTAQEKKLFNPEQIEVTNLSDTQATIIWWTDELTTGQIAYGTGNSLNQTQNDSRDLSEVKSRQVHFVTLRNLQPETTYRYQIVSNSLRFPDKPQTFKTLNTLENLPANRPLRGSVLNVNFNPIDEAFVFIKIDGAAEMVTFTSTAGNFIIPLRELRTSDLSNGFTINPNTSATLLIKKGSKESQVQLTLPIADNQLLPPLTLGQDINLKDIIAPDNSARSSTPTNTAEFDLNGDGKTNSLDLAIITQNNGKKISAIQDEKIKKADLNHDGTIDKKDADLLISKL